MGRLEAEIMRIIGPRLHAHNTARPVSVNLSLVLVI